MPYGFGSRESQAIIRRTQSTDQCAIPSALSNRHLLDQHKPDGRSGSLHNIHLDGSEVHQEKKKSAVKKIRSLGMRSSESHVVHGRDIFSGSRKFSLTSLGKRLSSSNVRKSRLTLSTQVDPRSPHSPPAESTNRIRSLMKRKTTVKLSAPAALCEEVPEGRDQAAVLPAKSPRVRELQGNSHSASKTAGRKAAKSMHDEECHSDDDDDDVLGQGAGGGWGGLITDCMSEDGSGTGDQDADGEGNNEITMGSRDSVLARKPAGCTSRTPDMPVTNWDGWGSDDDSDDKSASVATSCSSVMLTTVWSHSRSGILPSMSSPSVLNEIGRTEGSDDMTLSTQGVLSRFKKKDSRAPENQW